jgi:hypothetical protein
VSIHHLRISINRRGFEVILTHPLHVFSSSPRLGFLEKEGHLKYTFADALAAVADALAAVKEDLKQRGSRSVQGSVF